MTTKTMDAQRCDCGCSRAEALEARLAAIERELRELRADLRAPIRRSGEVR
jgi:hypothetical protein